MVIKSQWHKPGSTNYFAGHSLTTDYFSRAIDCSIRVYIDLFHLSHRAYRKAGDVKIRQTHTRPGSSLNMPIHRFAKIVNTHTNDARVDISLTGIANYIV